MKYNKKKTKQIAGRDHKGTIFCHTGEQRYPKTGEYWMNDQYPYPVRASCDYESLHMPSESPAKYHIIIPWRKLCNEKI